MAIKDGVDVLSLSMGGDMGIRFDLDPIAIGAFSAVSKGIVVVCAGGNNGDWDSTVVNDTPWILTVASGSVDRSFSAELRLGNGKRIHGEALTQKKNAKASTRSSYPLVFSKARRYCDYHNVSSIAGKILVCEAIMNKTQKSDIRNIMGAGAAGVVLFNDETSGYTTQLQDYNSSVVQVTAADGLILTSYATSRERRPVAAFTYKNTLLGIRPGAHGVVVLFTGSKLDLHRRHQAGHIGARAQYPSRLATESGLRNRAFQHHIRHIYGDASH
jgi:hypothetical protein